MQLGSALVLSARLTRRSQELRQTLVQLESILTFTESPSAHETITLKIDQLHVEIESLIAHSAKLCQEIKPIVVNG